MSKDVLIISAMPGAEHCARTLAGQMQARVEVAASTQALAILAHDAFGVVVVEESLVEADPEWADRVWAASGAGLPLQVNFAITGVARLCREVRAALTRRDGEQAAALKVATEQIEHQLRSSVTGLLLESQLALRDAQCSPSVAARMRHLVELAGTIRERLGSST